MPASISQLFQPAPPGVVASGASVPSTAAYTVTGTVAVNNGANGVTGTGTTFTAQLSAGQTIAFAQQPGATYTVQAIASDTSLTLTANYTGTNASATTITATATSWLQALLNGGASLGLPTTSWQAGDPLRTTYAILALQLGKEDSIVSQQSQGGFLDFAATGVFPVTDLNGNTVQMPVSPDPSIPGQNPTGAPTWLDVLASSRYNVSRVPAAPASGPLYFVNTTGSSLGTFAAGTFHAANSLTGATFSNQASFTFAPSTVVGTSIASVTYGATVAITTTAAHGRATGDVVFLKNVPGLNAVQMPGSGSAAAGTGGGFATITVTGANTFTLNGVSGSGTYTGTPLGLVYLASSVSAAADLVGTVGNSAVGQITQPITSIPGGAIANLAALNGTPWQSNTSLAAACRAKLASLSPNGAAGAYVTYALLASLILAGKPVAVTQANPTGILLPNPLPVAINLDGGAITKATVPQNTGSGTVSVIVANSNGAVAGCINNAISNATATSPIQITSANHGLQTGDYCQVNAVAGLAGANGVWPVIRVDANNIQLVGSTGTGVYTAGTGALSGGDLYAVNAVLNAFATPNGVSESTLSATNVSVNIVATVYVPRALTSDYAAKVTTALGAYFAAFPIGGYNVDNANNVLPISAIEGILWNAGQNAGIVYTISVNGLTLNGGTADISVGTTGVAVQGTPAIQVIGV